MLNSGAVDLLSKEQLDFIIGHEIGHIKSHHVIYHTLASFFANLISSYPIASGLITPIQVGLLYWNRMSELTADRAALLACQDEEVAIDTVIKMAGVPQKFFKNLNLIFGGGLCFIIEYLFIGLFIYLILFFAPLGRMFIEN